MERQSSVGSGTFLLALLSAALCAFPCLAAPAAGAAAARMPGIFGLSLEDLGRVEVVTPSRKAEPIDQAPNVMYVITSDEIRHRGFTTLRQVLETVPGFAVFHRDLQYVAQVRGIAPNDNEKLTVMINGHSINQVFEPEVLGGPFPWTTSTASRSSWGRGACCTAPIRWAGSST